MSNANMTIILQVMVVLLIVITVAATFMIVSARRSAATNRKMMENMRLQSRYMDNTEDFCQRTGQMIDDIEASIAAGKLAGQDEAYLDKCNELLTYMHGGDSASEAVIADKKFLCQEEGIKFVDEIRRLPEASQMEEMDIVAILGNLLDNAIEGAQASGSESPFVSCSSRIERNIWTLEIRNAKNPGVRLRGDQLQTTKSDKANHGLGTRIVRAAASRYHGQIKFTDDGATFGVRVRVMLKKVKEHV